METATRKNELISKLRKDILSMQGFQPPSLKKKTTDFGLGGIEAAFPYGTFPTGAVHEFVSQTPVQSAATSGFLAMLLGRLMKDEGFCLWIGKGRTLFPERTALVTGMLNGCSHSLQECKAIISQGSGNQMKSNFL